MAVGFIGLGRMGSNMARNVGRAGHDLVVFNRTSSVAEEFCRVEGSEMAATARDLADRCDIVISMLADGDALLDTYDGDDGVLAGLRPDSVAVDMGTSGPSVVNGLRPRVEEKGAHLVDAPVSGSTPAAAEGSLLIMVGGTPELFDRVAPVLAAIGSPELVGPAGSAATLKLAVNSILYGLNEALAEASGVPAETVLDIVGRSAAGAPMVRYRKPQYLDPENTPITFTLDLAAKDIDLVLEAAEKAGTSMPQGVTTRRVLGDMISRGWGGQDLGFVIEAMRRIEAER